MLPWVEGKSPWYTHIVRPTFIGTVNTMLYEVLKCPCWTATAVRDAHNQWLLHSILVMKLYYFIPAKLLIFSCDHQFIHITFKYKYSIFICQSVCWKLGFNCTNERIMFNISAAIWMSDWKLNITYIWRAMHHKILNSMEFTGHL